MEVYYNYIIQTDQEIICYENKNEVFRTLKVRKPIKYGNWAIYCYSETFQGSYRGSLFKTLDKRLTSFDAVFIPNDSKHVNEIYIGLLVAIILLLLVYFLLKPSQI